MEFNLDKVSSTTKNIVYLIGVIALAVTAYNKIFSNEYSIRQAKIEREQEQKLRDVRSDKRYKRAMKLGDDHEKRLRELEAFENFIKGKEDL